MKVLREKIKRYKEKNNISYYKLGLLMNISETATSKFINGIGNPLEKTIDRVIEFIENNNL